MSAKSGVKLSLYQFRSESIEVGSPDLERGTHFVHFDGEEFLQVANLVEGRYGSADGAGYLSWVMLGRAGGRRRDYKFSLV